MTLFPLWMNNARLDNRHTDTEIVQCASEPHPGPGQLIMRDGWPLEEIHQLVFYPLQIAVICSLYNRYFSIYCFQHSVCLDRIMGNCTKFENKSGMWINWMINSLYIFIYLYVLLLQRNNDIKRWPTLLSHKYCHKIEFIIFEIGQW